MTTVEEKLEDLKLNHNSDVENAEASKSDPAKKKKKKKPKKSEEVSQNGTAKQSTPPAVKALQPDNEQKEEQEDNDGDDQEDAGGAGGEGKKRRRRKKKPAASGTVDPYVAPNATSNQPNVAESKAPTKQTSPPSIPIKDLFPDAVFPIGQIVNHPLVDGRTAADRFSSEEKRTLETADFEYYNDVRQAAEAHRQTRKYMQEYIKPGMSMINIWCVMDCNASTFFPILIFRLFFS